MHRFYHSKPLRNILCKLNCDCSFGKQKPKYKINMQNKCSTYCKTIRIIIHSYKTIVSYKLIINYKKIINSFSCNYKLQKNKQ